MNEHGQAQGESAGGGGAGLSRPFRAHYPSALRFPGRCPGLGHGAPLGRQPLREAVPTLCLVGIARRWREECRGGFAQPDHSPSQPTRPHPAPKGHDAGAQGNALGSQANVNREP